MCAAVGVIRNDDDDDSSIGLSRPKRIWYRGLSKYVSK